MDHPLLRTFKLPVEVSSIKPTTSNCGWILHPIRNQIDIVGQKSLKVDTVDSLSKLTKVTKIGREKHNVIFLYSLKGFLEFFIWDKNQQVKDIASKQLIFQDNISSKAEQFLTAIPGMFPYLSSNKSRSDMTFVGIHIRRGDMANVGQARSRGPPPPASYFFKAMDYLANKYKQTPIVFVVCTDDKLWFTNNIENKTNYSVVLSNFEDYSVDFAILSKCNHSIMSVGTFGFWSALSAGGDTVYYKKWKWSLTMNLMSDQVLKDMDNFVGLD